ncbi:MULTISPECIES: CCA tRNA nucleotidyltransferase [unclassified Clostridioides]|uniref:CCA tRNA nucleotidyltransferase n=1 Tax=unclassified Clostridioides TaxID=2635829 RepID=UPI001D0C9D8C|nr:CCA tRNA nucleotidyltransferase [Clostridioides sp. ES-S-0001-02]MCC0639187.1 CCA tRNA nucleotidyltransferase [Clostridioides sp. ES-S-0049-03]MCC0652928.1 CCA tRNA nucleotidyltransferase [Clostridioides sp. ES-S-0001-03]MCC0675577.1 CCA tRNA nucleotidyltransferase [Clostridioides sp. ES-W-0018-02]MCC0709614.1 CCA tRNA nucleotidyltransferase [Clostridioides sp. ES-W-0017-02]MCC0761610.1 CCA tRNA nucleotidyltransferase [Clostridioides sp. ES-S-0006-03]UDN59598.1 CCA tRNA nucleotidyltransfer
MTNIEIPKKVDYIIKELEKNGYEAYVVGGCVRDCLLEKIPNDWDITTSARPEKVVEIFERTIPTGIQHGTVTVMIEHEPFEVTTYRIDGSYSDGRHPDSIEFTNDIVKDLSRRDFTVNAIAYNSKTGLVDPFNGCEDIQNKCIRCVGNPVDRFEEDALRMLRAIRFSAQLNFKIAEDTKQSIYRNADLIKCVSMERIQVEFNKMLISDSSKLNLLISTGLLKFIIPEICDLEDVIQNNPYHIYNVGKHTLIATEVIEDELYLKLTMLFHDLGKKITKTTDKNGIDHFYSHSRESVKIAKQILKRLKYDNYTINKVLILIQYHDYRIEPKRKIIKKLLNKLGDVELFEDLIKVNWADTLAKNPKYAKQKILNLIESEKEFKHIISQNECFHIKDLAINGNDLMSIGVKPGKDIGYLLNKMLEIVINNPELNEKEILKGKVLDIYTF